MKSTFYITGDWVLGINTQRDVQLIFITPLQTSPLQGYRVHTSLCWVQNVA
ncbi:hypothetical protein NIES2111_14810 [Nostoc sp. NIES-2111]|jgi:hypothetical protein|nr:hypothetical protein NIES2111_14810 [Nostoc sp. NIES-2111]